MGLFGKKETTTAQDAYKRYENQRYQKQVTRQAQARAKAAQKERGVWQKRSR